MCVSLAVLFCLNGMGNENKQPITELKCNTIFSTHMINNYFLRPKKHGFSVVLSQTILSLAKFVKKSIKIYHIEELNYENTFHIVSNEAHLILYMLLLSFSTNLIKLSMV